MYVLLVEDDDLIRINLTELMTEVGFEIVAAPDGESALVLLERMRLPLVVVSDVNLGPGMDGFALVAAVRHRWPGVPVLLISGVAANFVGRHCDAPKCFLPKPFSFGTLLQSVNDLTGKPSFLTV